MRTLKRLRGRSGLMEHLRPPEPRQMCTPGSGGIVGGTPGWEAGEGAGVAPEHSLQSSCARRSERETAVRISQEIGNLMKEIETLVEEKTKESLDVSRLTREGERTELRPLQGRRPRPSCPAPGAGLASPGALPDSPGFHLEKALRLASSEDVGLLGHSNTSLARYSSSTNLIRLSTSIRRPTPKPPNRRSLPQSAHSKLH